MEKSTRKSSKNSSIPPSQTEQDQSSTTKGSNGKGLSQNDEPFDNCRTTESISVAKVGSCSNCDENLSGVSVLEHERRTRIDIVFEKRVEHVDAENKSRPSCNHSTKGQFPSDMAGPVQYGLGVKAYILNLLITQMVSLSRTQKLLKTLIGRAISESVMLKYIIQLHKALERLHAKRGSAAIDEINIIPRYGGITIHDCWASYFSYQQSGDGLCGSHLLRELEFIIDSNGYAWAKNMKELLRETCAKVSKRRLRN